MFVRKAVDWAFLSIRHALAGVHAAVELHSESPVDTSATSVNTMYILMNAQYTHDRLRERNKMWNMDSIGAFERCDAAYVGADRGPTVPRHRRNDVLRNPSRVTLI